jgi:GNAT superfamily N-acetyltransferase
MQGIGAMDTFKIRPATAADSDDVCTLVFALFSELFPGMYALDRLRPVVERVMTRNADVFAFIACRNDEPVGLMVLNQCTAIYALGIFGEITELYIDPRVRSSGLGGKLIETAVELARSRGWTMLEVGAPGVPAWQRTVDFYLRNGFEEVGPRLYRSFVEV